MPEDGTAAPNQSPAATTGSKTPAEPAPARPSKTAHPEGSIKDTVESILVAFILAFVFRAFVVEAFVIPTGSMAPTLLGAHMQFTCTDCGYRYAVNYSAGEDLTIPPFSPYPIGPGIYCPNCGYAVPEVASAGEADRQAPAIHYGDRILVLKYRYLVAEPQRWDVVVFKSPDNPPAGATLYTTNYIKRLVGKPLESVMLLDGDIYVSTAAPPADNSAADHEAFLKTFTIQRKPKYAQAALWRTVYDNDFLPHLKAEQRSGRAWKQPWIGGDGWDVGQNLPGAHQGRTRAFRFDSATGSGAIEFNPAANRDASGLNDFLAYDQLAEQASGRRDQIHRNTVNDLRLACFYTRQSGDGVFNMTMTKRGDSFVAELTPGKASLVWTKPNGEQKRYGPVDVPALATDKPVELALVNVDYTVALSVGGRDVLTTGDDYTPTGDAILAIERGERSASSDWSVPPRVQISASAQKCVLEHVSISRDVFYNNNRNARIPNTGEPRLGSPDHIVTLNADEFFVLGDNSLLSHDARMWSNHVKLPGEDLFTEAGRVPKRFMLGKAFFVYWPAGYRPGNLSWGIIPNFGEMRFIH